MVIYNINQIINSINQITLGDMNMKNIAGQSQPARRQQGQLIWKIQKDQQLILSAGSSPYSSGTGPAHHRVEKGQLIWKIVKEISEKA